MRLPLWMRMKLFLLHPIWHYSLPQLFKAVRRDWDGPVGSGARAILDAMGKHGITEMTVEFKNGEETFLAMDCRVYIPKATAPAPGDGKGGAS